LTTGGPASGTSMTVGDPLPDVERTVTQADINRYAEASGDRNPVHLDPVAAAASVFGTRVAHGMMVAAMISQSLTEAFGAAWIDSGRLKIRFKAPVKPGETVVSSGKVTGLHRDGDGTRADCQVGVSTKEGEAVITGTASVWVED